MKPKELASYIAKHEGKKHSITIGDAREVVAILSDLIALEPFMTGDTYVHLYKNGKRRLKAVKHR